jgi:hypothetical protein
MTRYYFWITVKVSRVHSQTQIPNYPAILAPPPHTVVENGPRRVQCAGDKTNIAQSPSAKVGICEMYRVR